jgi:hypothetical protein
MVESRGGTKANPAESDMCRSDQHPNANASRNATSHEVVKGNLRIDVGFVSRHRGELLAACPRFGRSVSFDCFPPMFR